MMLASTVQESAQNPCNLASIQLSYGCRWWFNRGNSKVCGEFCRKIERAKCEDYAFGSRSEPKWNVNPEFCYDYLYIWAVNDSPNHT